MKDRLAEFLKSEGLSPRKFSDLMDVPPSNISHLLAGRNKPGFEFISRMISRFPNLSPDWLILGVKPMYRAGKITGAPEAELSHIMPSTSTPDGATESTEQNSAATGPASTKRPLLEISDKQDNVGAEQNNISRQNAKSEVIRAVNQEEPVAQPQSTACGLMSQKAAEQIAVLYSDGTFKIFHQS